ncbi:hypothetical protein QUF58_01950 [Anaerolineales bacterium HSG24]|nr:hypothetical protein [Anaerolineales bacterium HSG24]
MLETSSISPNLEANIPALREKVIEEIKRISDDELIELYRFVLYFRLGWERLREIEARQAIVPDKSPFQLWLAKSEALSNRILKRREGKPLDVDTLWQSTRDDLESKYSNPAPQFAPPRLAVITQQISKCKE